MKKKALNSIEVFIIVVVAILSFYFFTHWDAIEKFIAGLF